MLPATQRGSMHRQDRVVETPSPARCAGTARYPGVPGTGCSRGAGHPRARGPKEHMGSPVQTPAPGFPLQWGGSARGGRGQGCG